MIPPALPRRFFARDADVVARDLLGRTLVRTLPRGRRIACRIVETEAYFGPARRNPQLASRRDMPAALRRHLLERGDPASHSFRGVTTRNRVMYGPPGHWYVYLIYGMHECANVVTGPDPDHEPQAVLLRAGEPLDGLDADADLGGPGRLAKHMRITRADYGRDATKAPLFFEEGAPVKRATRTPRIGVTGAEELPLRFVPASRRVPRGHAERTRERSA